MTAKLPAEVQEFAEFYYVCEDRAVKGDAKTIFRREDQKRIARAFKTLIESKHVESVDQLCKDLTEFRPGVSRQGHYYRLSNFAKNNNIHVNVYANRRRELAGDRPVNVIATIPAAFDFRAALQDGLTRALKAGTPFRTLHDQASEVLADAAHNIQVKTITGKLQGLLRESGMNRDQLAKIVGTL